MAKSAGGSGGDGPRTPEELPQHPYVDRLKPDPSQPAKRVVDLTGLPGNSDRPGYQRLYLTTKLDYYAEFLASDMVHSEAMPADQSPFPGQEATRVSVDRDATIHYIWARSPQPVDEFDLDIRLGSPRAAPLAVGLLPATHPPAHTCIFNGCTNGCPTQDTCPHTVCETCHTCQTCPGMATCAATCPATCAGHATCAAGATCAGHGTCVATQCADQQCAFTNNNAGTCVTCVFTACNQGTCANTACQQMACLTAPNTCAQTCHA
jgi:hypothetical protein